MFRQFARLSLRRCLHSQASFSARSLERHNRSFYALGASMTVALGYMAWSWNSNSRHISLDSEAVSAPQKQPASSIPPRASVSSSPESDASEPVRTPTEGEERFTASSETPAEGEEAQEESSGGAFNPETGEINWDCPCLGGMAHGPCGQQFREAFSCFVNSEADPKGIDCVEKFKAMQECFRQHPDVYGDEIMNDDDEEESHSMPPTAESSEDELRPTDSLPPETTERPSTAASS